MKQGYYNQDEDAIIIARVNEWIKLGKNMKGKWIELEAELGRPAKSISQRYRKQLKFKSEII